MTADGPKPIERVAPGDRCWALDVASGKWQLRPVVETYNLDYLGELVEIRCGGDVVQATYHHPFWVVEGEDLDARPEPDHLNAANAPGLAFSGRWVDAGELCEGDVLFGLPDRRLRVESLRTRSESVTVYNFQVAEHWPAIENLVQVL